MSFSSRLSFWENRDCPHRDQKQQHHQHHHHNSHVCQSHHDLHHHVQRHDCNNQAKQSNRQAPLEVHNIGNAAPRALESSSSHKAAPTAEYIPSWDESNDAKAAQVEREYIPTCWDDDNNNERTNAPQESTIKTQTIPTPERSRYAVNWSVKVAGEEKNVHLIEGSRLYAQGRLKEALAKFNCAVALDPLCFDAHLLAGSALFDLDRFDKAIETLNRAIQICPDNARAYFEKGFILCEVGMYSAAIEMFDMAIGMNCNFAEAYFEKGRALLGLDACKDAIDMFDQAIKLNGRLMNAVYYKGLALASLGQQADSQAMFSQLDPSFLESISHEDPKEVHKSRRTHQEQKLDCTKQVPQIPRRLSDIPFALDQSDLCIPRSVVELLGRSWRDWESDDGNLLNLERDLSLILGFFATAKYSVENLMSFVISMVWLLVNVTHTKSKNGVLLWQSIPKILNHFCTDYRAQCDVQSYRKMKNIVDSFFNDVTLGKGFYKYFSLPDPCEREIVQSVPNNEDELEYLLKKAKELESAFRSELRSVNRNCRCNVKGVSRIREKIKKYEAGYRGVLDYLRGTIYIPVDEKSSVEYLKDRVKSAYLRLQDSFGQVKRVKMVPIEEAAPLPRFLLNLQFEGLICEVQIRFLLWGMDVDFHDFIHEIYELQRDLELSDVDPQQHIVIEIRKILEKFNIRIDENLQEKWVKDCNGVEFSFEDRKSDDKDSTKVCMIKLVTNRGTGREKKLCICCEKEFLVNENGNFVTLPHRRDQYQVQIKDNVEIAEEDPVKRSVF